MEWLELSSRSIYAVGRFLLWLVWDMLICMVAWWIGWPICRVLCFGKFPDAGFWDYEASEWHEAFFVCLVGLAALSGTVGYLAQRLS